MRVRYIRKRATLSPSFFLEAIAASCGCERRLLGAQQTMYPLVAR